jgi:hypothetical protein
MAIAIYAVILLTCSFTLCIFGFFVGRCARKVPILDNNLPRALYRGQTPSGSPHPTESAAGATRCPEDD